MLGTIRGLAAAESRSDGKFAAEKETNVKSDVPDMGWFADMVQALHPHKPGTALHYLTGYDERLCQKYAAGSVKPSAYFLRNLLHSDQGWQHLAAIMDGSNAAWWRELIVRKECADAYEARRAGR